MGREINEGHIRHLDKKIREGIGDTIQLKRTRNSLLNISTRLPPEILGHIFRWRVVRNIDHPRLCGLPEGSYDFRLVCHYWFEVASHTPELWSYWGNTSGKLLQRYKLSRSTPVDLGLCSYGTCGLEIDSDGHLRDALRERAEHNAIRSLHLDVERQFLTEILSVIAPDGEGVRCSNIESIGLYYAELFSSRRRPRYLDISQLFTRCRYPKLRHLHLSSQLNISSWEHLALHTATLTTLTLNISDRRSSPTVTQLLSILSSNPRLRVLDLASYAVPCNTGDGPTFPVALRHLKRLSIDADPNPVSQLLRWLDYPEGMDMIELTTTQCTVEETVGILGPFARDFIQRHVGFRDGIGVFVTSDFDEDTISIEIGTVDNINNATQMTTLATFGARDWHYSHGWERFYVDFVAHLPAGSVVYFGGCLHMNIIRKLISTMPNIRELHLTKASLEGGFLLPDLEGPLATNKLLPSLQRLHLEEVRLRDEGWRPLLPYLVHQTSDGQKISLTITGEHKPDRHLCKVLLREMVGLVEELVFNLPLDDRCRWDFCPIRPEDEDEDEGDENEDENEEGGEGDEDEDEEGGEE